jgi:hypothetical protein
MPINCDVVNQITAPALRQRREIWRSAGRISGTLQGVPVKDAVK